jgi:hypothetical protein
VGEPPQGPGVAKVRKRSEARPKDDDSLARRPPPAEVSKGSKTEVIAKVSEDLNASLVMSRVKELEGAEDQLKAQRGRLAREYKFQMVQRAEDKTSLRADLGRIVETAWVEDMHKVWEKLKANLRLGVKRRSYAHLSRALDDVRQIQFEASSLYATAMREQKRWQSENEVSHGAMWNKATMVLQAEKDAGMRSKSITNDDVTAMAAVLFEDEWVTQETKKSELELVVELIKNLTKAAAERGEDLRVLLGKHRG